MSPERNPQQTRQRILEAAFEEMHENGFQGMRIDKVLQRTQMAKGALYHHFPTKQSLGYAIVDELIYQYIYSVWVERLQSGGDPITNLQDIVRYYVAEYGNIVVRNGCPLVNLSQEMPALDEGFRDRLFKIYSMWVESIAAALRQGQQQKQVKPELNAEIVAKFFICSFKGSIMACKCSQSLDEVSDLSTALIDYVETLRA